MRVLSIDGGGIRGLIPAMVLADLERRAGRPAYELFDVVAGTSTGGIIACALGTGRPAAEVVPLYLDEGPRIFHRSLLKRVTSADGILDEKYDDAALNAALEQELGAALLGDARLDVLVTAYDLQARSNVFFKSWRDEWRGVRMTDVARATSAAPTYFEPWLVDGRPLIDGGVFATNPAMSAYAEVARRSGVDVTNELVLVSLGTGSLTRPIAYEDARGWGRLEWVRPVIDVVFDGVASAVTYQLDHLLGDRHHRFQPTLTTASDALDDASQGNLAALQDQARDLVAERSDELDALARAL